MEFLAWKPINLILGLFAAFLIVLAIASYSGQLNNIFSGFCDKWPMFCGSGDVDEQVARASTDALVCAVNSVNTGDPSYAEDCEIEGVAGQSTNNKGGNILTIKPESVGKMVLKPSIDKNSVARKSFTGLVSMLSLADENPSSGPISCEQGEIKDYSIPFIVFAEDETKARETCDKTCDYGEPYTECTPKVTEKTNLFGKTKTTEYHEMRPQGKYLQCECRNDNIGDGITKDVTGVDMMDLMENCKKYMEDNGGSGEEVAKSYIVPGTCKEVEPSYTATGLTSYMVKNTETIESRAIKVTKCTCNINLADSENYIYPVYGSNEEEARMDCKNDYDYLYENVYNVNIGDYSTSNCKQYDGDMSLYTFKESSGFLFFKKDYNYPYQKHTLQKYQCDQERIGHPQKCTVIGFSLPQSFKGLKRPEEWIEGFGDPKFLVYFDSRYP